MFEESKPEYIDPRTFHSGTPDHLRFLIQAARAVLGQVGNDDKAILLYEEEKNGAPHYKVHPVDLDQLLAEASFPCPKAADDEYEKGAGEPRPVPSALVMPDGNPIVSKPSLCDSCVHSLRRKIHGHCYGQPYTPLEEFNP